MYRFRGRYSTGEPRSAVFLAGAALCEPRSADFVAGVVLCEPRRRSTLCSQMLTLTLSPSLSLTHTRSHSHSLFTHTHFHTHSDEKPLHAQCQSDYAVMGCLHDAIVADREKRPSAGHVRRDTPIGQIVFIGNFRRRLAQELLVRSLCHVPK